MKSIQPRATLVAFLSLLLLASPAFAWISAKVPYDANGRLTYPADGNGNRIPDFSHAGYKGGGVPLPTNLPVRVTVSPIACDDTANIQAAIDQVGSLAVQPDGYRGTVLLAAGVYDIAGTLRLNQSGVVLAGVGDGDASATNTLLRRTGTSLADVITAGGGTNDSFKSEIAGSRVQITSPNVQVGSRSFTVDNPAPFAVGDPVVIFHPSTAGWITAMNQGGVTDANVWKPGEIDTRYHRYITAISGSTITVDAPVFMHLNQSLSQSYLYKYDATGVLRNIGIEDLQIDIVTAGPTSETHCEDAIQFVEAEDSWIRDCTIKHFWHAGVQFVGSTRSTVERVRAIDPHSVVTGGRRYNFSTYQAQLILFQDCFASYARHGFVANGTSLDSGNVVLRGTLDHSLTFAEGHRRWSTGLLFDGIVATNRDTTDILGFYNRGNYGTGHGWAVGHGVIWNCNAAGGKILVQQPPTAQNYAIGNSGNVTGTGPFAGAAGYIEGSNTSGLVPASLYTEQLAQRLGTAAPVFSPGGGTYTAAQSVTITSATAGASIRYTLDGSTPTSTTGTVYSGAVTIGTTTTLKALAYKTGWSNSAVTTATYTVNLPTAAAPVFSPGGGTYTSAQSVAITSGTSGASIRYTLDGSTPTSTTGTLYASPVTVAASATLKAIAYKSTHLDSAVSIATYTINLPVLVSYEAENLTRTVSGATASVGADASASGGSLVYFSADGAGDYIEFTTPNVTAGTYSVKLAYKAHPNRGQHSLRIDGTPVGGTLDQYAATAGFLESTFGTVTFAASGPHLIRLTSTGKNAAAGAFTISADKFTLTPVVPSAKLTVPGTSVTASADDGNVPANTVDANLATRWSASGDGQWIRFDLGSTKTITSVKIAFFSGDVRTSTFDVQTSPDGSTWSTRGSFTSSGTSLALETFNSTDASARYVRLLGHGNSVNLWNSYTEVEIWGY